MILRDVGANINYFRPSLQSAINHYSFVGLCCCTLCVVQVENVQYINSMQMLHRASCTLPTFFMFYELENTIIIKNATLCVQHTMYFLCITRCNTKYFWAAMICKTSWAVSKLLLLLLYYLVWANVCMEWLNM
jgi:hypothetical protein